MLSTAIALILTRNTHSSKPSSNSEVSITDAKNFCLFHDSSSSRCFGSPQSSHFPTGFITSGHVVKTKTYIQLTGTFNPSTFPTRKDVLEFHDPQGNADPPHCKGYTHFVQLMETIDEKHGHYCLRCCNDGPECGTKDEADGVTGCSERFGGDYGPKFTTIDLTKSSKESSKVLAKVSTNSTLIETDSWMERLNTLVHFATTAWTLTGLVLLARS